MSCTHTTQGSLTAHRASKPAGFDVSTTNLYDAAQASGGGLYKVKSGAGQSLEKTRSKETEPMPATSILAPPTSRPKLRRRHTSDSRLGSFSHYAGTYSGERRGSSTSYNLQPNAESAADSSQDEKKSTRKGWSYKPVNFGGVHFPAFKSPSAQLTLLGLVFCFGPGLFCMLNGLGGGGLANPVPSNDALVANNIAIALVGFFAGPIVSKLGFRISMSLGGFGYVLYTSSLLTYQITGNGPFLITSGAVLGVLCSLLWTAQGAMLMSYPLPRYKGRYTSYVWTIFNVGAAGASLIVLVQNLHSSSGSISNVTYVVVISLTALSFLLAMFVCNAKDIERADGSHVVLPEKVGWTSGTVNLMRRLKTDMYIIALFPLFFSSNYFFPYQLNDINLAVFNVRTRALNNTLFWASEIPGAYAAGYTLDAKLLNRPTRVKVALGGLLLTVMSIWGSGYAWQTKYTRPQTSSPDFVKVDLTDPEYIAPMFLMIAYGFFDGVWQTSIYWFMGALADNSSTASVADFAGFFKSLQSVGAAVAWKLNNLKSPFMVDLCVTWGILVGSLLCAAPMLMVKIKDIDVIDGEKQEYDEERDG